MNARTARDRAMMMAAVSAPAAAATAAAKEDGAKQRDAPSLPLPFDLSRRCVCE